MTDTACAAPAAALSARVPARDRRAPARAVPRRPQGVPGWLWLLGVTVLPTTPQSADSGEPTGWVVSAGAGTTYVAALFHDSTSDS